jgi:hypothetical protein
MRHKWFVYNGSNNKIEEIPPETFLMVNVASTRTDGGKSLIVDGYDFTKQKDNADGSTTYRCCEVNNKRCNMSVKIDGNQLIFMTNV